MAETERKPGFYWVRFKASAGSDSEWIPASYGSNLWFGECWFIVGTDQHFYEYHFEEIGEKIERG